MGEAPGKQQSLPNNDVAILQLYWKEYVELFGTNRKRVDRFNQTIPAFFRMLQTELFQTNIHHLARLNGTPKTISTGVGADFDGANSGSSGTVEPVVPDRNFDGRGRTLHGRALMHFIDPYQFEPRAVQPMPSVGSAGFIRPARKRIFFNEK